MKKYKKCPLDRINTKLTKVRIAGTRYIIGNISNRDFLWSLQREASEPATVAIDIGLEIEPRQQNPQQKGQQKGETEKNDEKEEKTFGYG